MRLYRAHDDLRWHFEAGNFDFAWAGPAARDLVECKAMMEPGDYALVEKAPEPKPVIIEKQLNYRLGFLRGFPFIFFRVAPPGDQLAVTIVGAVLSADYRFSHSFSEVITLPALMTMASEAESPLDPQTVMATVEEVLTQRARDWLRLNPNPERWSK